MKRILLVGHCILNTASKVVLYDREEIEAEDRLRKEFLLSAVEKDFQIIQLPCPEFTLYGARRWGHVSEQFDNVFFRGHCRKLLEPIMQQLLEYRENGERFRIVGIIGIDGSPSCGVDYTCTGAESYGCLGGRDESIMDVIHSTRLCGRKGILIRVLEQLLEEYGLSDIPVAGLYAPEPEKCMDLLETEHSAGQMVQSWEHKQKDEGFGGKRDGEKTFNQR